MDKLVFINTVNGNKHRYTVDDVSGEVLVKAYRDDSIQVLSVSCIETGMSAYFQKRNIDSVQIQKVK